ncbi:MAG TPA: hypothetical protein VLY24_06160 [Bryobacteraceae bacterium]|nr:hypothetical protein [Bryobacteraceae bacterium]
MHKLPPVEQAKELMSEAQDWGVWRWLLDKGKVRAAADEANDSLAEAEKQVKAAWSEELRKAYRGNGRMRDLDPEWKLALEKVREADEAAETAHLDAEATFAEAERRLSTSMAREGAQKAIASWELREKAIRRAEALARKK